jgi:hypothetical protein
MQIHNKEEALRKLIGNEYLNSFVKDGKQLEGCRSKKMSKGT